MFQYITYEEDGFSFNYREKHISLITLFNFLSKYNFGLEQSLSFETGSLFSLPLFAYRIEWEKLRVSERNWQRKFGNLKISIFWNCRFIEDLDRSIRQFFFSATFWFIKVKTPLKVWGAFSYFPVYILKVFLTMTCIVLCINWSQ